MSWCAVADNDDPRGCAKGIGESKGIGVGLMDGFVGLTVAASLGYVHGLSPVLVGVWFGVVP